MDIKEIKNKEIREKVEAVLTTFEGFDVPMELVRVIEGSRELHIHLNTKKAVRMAAIAKFDKDLRYALGAQHVTIEAPITGEKLIGVTVPMDKPPVVERTTLLKSDEYTKAKGELLVPLGMDDFKKPLVYDLTKFPHLLIGGMTGTGKSILHHQIVTSLIEKYPPEHLRFVMIDTKRVELSLYAGIPHLLTPVIGDIKKSVLALKWTAKEMDRRYDILMEHRANDIKMYHEQVAGPHLKRIKKAREQGREVDTSDFPELMPYIVVLLDDLADIMVAYPREMEAVVVRLAQMSRAVGIHLILNSQRTSANVLTGLMKANMPARIAFKVASLIDSRTVLDLSGAEKLEEAGDALFLGPFDTRAIRFQVPFISAKGVQDIARSVSKHYPHSDVQFTDTSEEDEEYEADEFLEEAAVFVRKEGRASTSLLQRRFKIGYGRAARLMDDLESHSVVAPSDGTNKPRAILMPVSDAEEIDSQDSRVTVNTIEKTLAHLKVQCVVNRAERTPKEMWYLLQVRDKKAVAQVRKLKNNLEQALGRSPISFRKVPGEDDSIYIALPL